MATRYVVGTLVRVSATFLDEDDVAADPTTVTAKYDTGTAASEVTYIYGTDAELVKDSVGLYHFDITTTVENRKHSYRFEGTGTLVAAVDGYFLTKPSKFI